MAHLATMMQGFSPWRVNLDDFQKTVAINDFYLAGPGRPYPLGQIQSQGRTHPVMAKIVGDTWSYKGVEWRHIPLWAYDAWVSRAVDWLAMTEDLPRAENRVTLASDGRIRLEYRPNNVRAHSRLVDELRRVLRAARVLVTRGVRVFCGGEEHDPSVRHDAIRRGPADIGARPFLPHARRVEPVRG